MQDHVTLLPPDAPSAAARGHSSTLPPDLLEQVRGRVRLLTLGLVYEVAICLVMALIIFWQFYLDTGTLPNLTWVPVVIILFPLILPVPPRRTLAAAVLAGAMPPLALLGDIHSSSKAGSSCNR